MTESEDVVLRINFDKKYRFVVITKKESSVKELKSEICKIARLVLSQDVREVKSLRNSNGFELPEIYNVGRLLKEQEVVLAYSNRPMPTFSTINSTMKSPSCSGSQDKTELGRTTHKLEQRKINQPLFQKIIHDDNNDDDDGNDAPQETSDIVVDTTQFSQSLNEKQINSDGIEHCETQQSLDSIVESRTNYELGVSKCCELKVPDSQPVDSQMQHEQFDFIVENESCEQLQIEKDSQTEGCEEHYTAKCATERKHFEKGEVICNSYSEDEDGGIVALMQDCQNTTAIMGNADCTADKTSCNWNCENLTNQEKLTSTCLTRKDSLKENIVVGIEPCKEKEEVLKENSTMKCLEKQLQKGKQWKSSRTQSIDESLPEDEKNSTSNNSQQSSSISELVFKSPTFQSMLKNKAFRRRRQALEKSVNKVASWLVESEAESNLDDAEYVHNEQSEIGGKDDRLVDKPTPSKIYHVVDVADDKVIYYDSDPSDVSYSGGVLRESNLLSCTMVLPYFCTEGTAEQFSRIYRKRSYVEEHIENNDCCKETSNSRSKELPGRCKTRLLTHNDPVHSYEVDDNDGVKSCVSTEILHNDDGDDNHVDGPDENDADNDHNENDDDHDEDDDDHDEDDDDNNKRPSTHESSQHCTESNNQSLNNHTVEQISNQSPLRQSPRHCDDTTRENRGIRDSAPKQIPVHDIQRTNLKNSDDRTREEQDSYDLSIRTNVQCGNVTTSQNEQSANRNNSKVEDAEIQSSKTSQYNRDQNIKTQGSQGRTGASVETASQSIQPITEINDNELHKDSQETQSGTLIDNETVDQDMGSSTESELEKQLLTQCHFNIAKKLIFDTVSMSGSEDLFRNCQPSKITSKYGGKKQNDKARISQKAPGDSKASDSDSSSSDSDQEKDKSAAVKKNVRFLDKIKEDSSMGVPTKAGPSDKAVPNTASDSDSSLDDSEDNNHYKAASKVSNNQHTTTKKPETSVSQVKKSNVKGTSKSDSSSDSDSDSNEGKQKQEDSAQISSSSNKLERKNTSQPKSNAEDGSISDSDSDNVEERVVKKDASKVSSTSKTSPSKLKRGHDDSNSTSSAKKKVTPKTANSASKPVKCGDTVKSCGGHNYSDSSLSDSEQEETDNKHLKKASSCKKKDTSKVKNDKPESDSKSSLKKVYGPTKQTPKQQQKSQSKGNAQAKGATEGSDSPLSDSDYLHSTDSEDENQQFNGNQKPLVKNTRIMKQRGKSQVLPKGKDSKTASKKSDSDPSSTDSEPEEDTLPSKKTPAQEAKSSAKKTPLPRSKSKAERLIVNVNSLCNSPWRNGKRNKVEDKSQRSDESTSNDAGHSKRPESLDVEKDKNAESLGQSPMKRKPSCHSSEGTNSKGSSLAEQSSTLTKDAKEDNLTKTKGEQSLGESPMKKRNPSSGSVVSDYQEKEENIAHNQTPKKKQRVDDSKVPETERSKKNFKNSKGIENSVTDKDVVENEGNKKKNMTKKDVESELPSVLSEEVTKESQTSDGNVAGIEKSVVNKSVEKETDHTKGKSKKKKRKNKKVSEVNNEDRETTEAQKKKESHEIVQEKRNTPLDTVGNSGKSAKTKKKKKHKKDSTEKDSFKAKTEGQDDAKDIKTHRKDSGIESDSDLLQSQKNSLKTTKDNKRPKQDKIRKSKKQKVQVKSDVALSVAIEDMDVSKSSVERQECNGHDRLSLKKKSKKKKQHHDRNESINDEQGMGCSSHKNEKKDISKTRNVNKIRNFPRNDQPDEQSPQDPSQQPEGTLKMFSSDSESDEKQRESVDSLLSWIQKKTSEPPKNKKRNKSLLDLIEDENENVKTPPSKNSFGTASRLHLTSRRSFHKTPIGFTNTLPRLKKKSSHHDLPLSYTKRKRQLNDNISKARELTPKEKEIVSGGINELDNLLSEDSFWDISTQ